MPLMSPISKRPFTPNERRILTLRAEVIDPKHIIDGEPPSIEAEHKRTERHPTHEARFYEIAISGRPSAVRVQLNHYDPADDAKRLTAITEDFLSPEPERLTAEG